MKIRIFIRSLCLLMLIGGGPAVGAQESPTSSESSLLEQSVALADGLQQMESEIRELNEKAEAAEGEERLLLEVQMGRRGRKILQDLDPLVANIVELREQGSDVSEIRARVETLLATALQFVRRELERLQGENRELDQRKGGGYRRRGPGAGAGADCE